MGKKFEKALQSLIDAVPTDLQDQVKHDIDSLLMAGARSFNTLLEIPQNQYISIDIRVTACWALGRLCDKRAVTVLLNVLNSQDVRLCQEAAKSLGILKSKRAVKPLITALLNNTSIERRAAYAYALGLLHDKSAIEPLLTVLNNKKEEPEVRGFAAEALARLGDYRVVNHLIEGLKDSSVEVRFWSVFALGKIGDQRALPELKRIASQDKAVLSGWWEISKEATEAIEQIRSRSCQLD